MTAVARPPRPLLGAHAAPDVVTDDEYVGRHRRAGRARHPHAAAAVLALALAWIPAASTGRGRHRR